MMGIWVAVFFRLIPVIVVVYILAAVCQVPGGLYVSLIDAHASPRLVGAMNWGTLGALVVGYLVHRGRSRSRSLGGTGQPPTSHGSAWWGTGKTLRRQAGYILGRLGPDVLRLDGEGHVLTLAPTGAGKGVSAVIPNLLTHPGSVLVTDPKGENYCVTARRRRELGQRVMALDPFDVVRGDASFNPLEDLDHEGPDAVDDAMRLAELLVIESRHETADSTFWQEECKALLAGLILHVASTESVTRRNLAVVWEYLSLPPRELTKLWNAMLKSTAADGAVARAAARVRQKADRVQSGILAQAQSHTHFLESPRLARVLHHSSFGFEDLKSQRVTLYLVVPPDRLDSARRWLRLMVGCAVHALTRVPGLPSERVLMLLDEFPSLGRLGPVERAFALARGYGVTLWLLAQDFAQLQLTYPTSWRSFYAGADVLQAFGANDWDTADYLSRQTGEATVVVPHRSQSTGTSRPPFSLVGSAQSGESHGVSERGRRLLTPDEVRRLPRHQSLVFVRGEDPLLVDRVNYLTDAEFRGTFDANPLHRRT
jgi:type IV secretion system protein VirD4